MSVQSAAASEKALHIISQSRTCSETGMWGKGVKRWLCKGDFQTFAALPAAPNGQRDRERWRLGKVAQQWNSKRQCDQMIVHSDRTLTYSRIISVRLHCGTTFIWKYQKKITAMLLTAIALTAMLLTVTAMDSNTTVCMRVTAAMPLTVWH